MPAHRNPWLFLILNLAACLPVYAQSPQGLRVVSATNKQVQLSWTAPDSQISGYTVERKPLNGDYAPLNPIPGAGVSFTDGIIDPFVTYTYRVRAVAGLTASAPSNEVTVGPPPVGFNLAAPVPAGLQARGLFGRLLSPVLDANGDAAFSYYFFNPRENDDLTLSSLHFVAWDRANYRWKDPVKVATIGDISQSVPNISLARDASNNVFGIAYQTSSLLLGLALSNDGGSTWNSRIILPGDSHNISAPSLALGKGQVYLAFARDFDGVRYMNGLQQDDPAKWTSVLAPFLPQANFWTPAIGIALDNAGSPGIAYVLDEDTGYQKDIMFWRPGVGNAVKATDTNGLQNDDIHLKLAFFGAQPRIAFAARLDDLYFSTNTHSDWVSAALDGGVNWAPPVPIPPDGNLQLGVPGLAIGSRGQGAVVADITGGNLDGVACGSPKLSRSDDLANWNTCSPSNGPLPNVFSYDPQVTFAANDKLYVLFGNTGNSDSDLPFGVIVWREP